MLNGKICVITIPNESYQSYWYHIMKCLLNEYKDMLNVEKSYEGRELELPDCGSIVNSLHLLELYRFVENSLGQLLSKRVRILFIPGFAIAEFIYMADTLISDFDEESFICEGLSLRETELILLSINKRLISLKMGIPDDLELRYQYTDEDVDVIKDEIVNICNGFREN